MMEIAQSIQQFLSAPAFGVAGASNNRNKFGNKVLRCYLQNNKKVYPINPRENSVEGLECVASVFDLPTEVQSLSIITPPAVTEKIVEQAIAKGIKNIWMQPGAESPVAVANCQKNNVNVIADGSCLLVVLHFRDII